MEILLKCKNCDFIIYESLDYHNYDKIKRQCKNCGISFNEYDMFLNFLEEIFYDKIKSMMYDKKNSSLEFIAISNSNDEYKFITSIINFFSNLETKSDIEKNLLILDKMFLIFRNNKNIFDETLKDLDEKYNLILDNKREEAIKILEL